MAKDYTYIREKNDISIYGDSSAEDVKDAVLNQELTLNTIVELGNDAKEGHVTSYHAAIVEGKKLYDEAEMKKISDKFAASSNEPQDGGETPVDPYEP